jgi:precorrin-2 dehydrogenase/sirohydrochlorin ferrochelatase
MFPVMLNLKGWHVVVVGYGAVGQRKAAAALAAGAKVVVVDPHLLPHTGSSPRVIAEPYRAEHLDGAALAFACATPDVNVCVIADAQARGVWVNSASQPETGDFFLPAVVRSGDLTIAVSTGGASPTLARRIREKLESEFDAVFADWVKLLGEMRDEVQAAVPDTERRRQLLDDFADWPWLKRLRAEGVDAVRTAMRREFTSPL